MTSLDRRFDHRIPFETYLNTYVNDQPLRSFSVNLSETGLLVNTLPQHSLPPFTPVGLELELPEFGETIWAAGEICRDLEDDYFLGRGIRFIAMANLHSRMLREYCYKLRRKRLGLARTMASFS